MQKKSKAGIKKLKSMERRKDGAERDSAKPGKKFTTTDHGMQGIDKAPGEESSNDQVQFTQETQKGKKVDADPSENEGKPAGQDL
jgi:hypothetical protein